MSLSARSMESTFGRGWKHAAETLCGGRTSYASPRHIDMGEYSPLSRRAEKRSAASFCSMSDIAFITGADLFGTCLHVENCVGAYYVTDSDWENLAPDEAARHPLSAESLESFIALLMASPMQDWSESGENGDIYSYGYAEAHLYLELADGAAVPLRLFENGCVKYDGSAARICAWMPGAIFDEVFDMCR